MMHVLFYSNKFGDWFQPNTFFSKGELVENFNDDLDQRIHSYLLSQSETEPKSFTLPISITGNFYDFSGLIFAHHIRLSRNIKCCDATIVFYGTLELEQLLRITPLARILLTTNVLYVNLVKYSFDDIRTSLESYLPKPVVIKKILEQIQVNPPSNYDSHHSIDNEFSLMQWSKYIGCYDSIPLHFKKEFDSNLYFKYLKALLPLSSIDSSQISISTTEKIKVLLIDDEAIKGWRIFYSSFFKNSNIDFIDSEIEFRNLKKNDIISKVESKVKGLNPDVVLLDLRLHDSDFEDGVKPYDLTGMMILEKIKGINNGIQVIITTASNKAWNFNLAKQKGAYDFIIKDGYDKPEKSINKLHAIIEISAKRAKFLKSICEQVTLIKELIRTNNHFVDKDDEYIDNQDSIKDKVRKMIFSYLDAAFELLDLSCEIPEKQKYFAYSYLQFFICIETFATTQSIERRYPILHEESDQIFLNFDTTSICISQKRNNDWLTKLVFRDGRIILQERPMPYNRKFDTNFYVPAILIYKYGHLNSSESKWTSIYTTRNKSAHEGYVPNINQITVLLNFIIKFFDDSLKRNNNLNNALTPTTYEESLQALINRYNNI